MTVTTGLDGDDFDEPTDTSYVNRKINRAASRTDELSYSKYFIGLSDGGRSRNVMIFQPRRKHMRLVIRVPEGDRWSEQLEEAGVEARLGRGKRLILTFSNLDVNRELVDEIIQTAVKECED